MSYSSKGIIEAPRMIAFIAVFMMTSVQTEAQVVKPFKITGSGIAPQGLPLPTQSARPHLIVGNATHLGRHEGLGSVKTDTATLDSINGRFTGQFGSGSPFVFVGANRDKLVCHYGRTDFGASQPGSFVLTIVGFTSNNTPIVRAYFIAEFVPLSLQCTGKFEGVTGSWIMYASTQPFILGSSDPIPYVWEGEGKLTFAKP